VQRSPPLVPATLRLGLGVDAAAAAATAASHYQLWRAAAADDGDGDGDGDGIAGCALEILAEGAQRRASGAHVTYWRPLLEADDDGEDVGGCAMGALSAYFAALAALGPPPLRALTLRSTAVGAARLLGFVASAGPGGAAIRVLTVDAHADAAVNPAHVAFEWWAAWRAAAASPALAQLEHLDLRIPIICTRSTGEVVGWFLPADMAAEGGLGSRLRRLTLSDGCALQSDLALFELLTQRAPRLEALEFLSDPMTHKWAPGDGDGDGDAPWATPPRRRPLLPELTELRVTWRDGDPGVPLNLYSSDMRDLVRAFPRLARVVGSTLYHACTSSPHGVTTFVQDLDAVPEADRARAMGLWASTGHALVVHGLTALAAVVATYPWLRALPRCQWAPDAPRPTRADVREFCGSDARAARVWRSSGLRPARQSCGGCQAGAPPGPAPAPAGMLGMTKGGAGGVGSGPKALAWLVGPGGAGGAPSPPV
jgi:hypothetical protein